MSILSDHILSLSSQFDDATYPYEVYRYLLEQLAMAKSPAALSHTVSHLLAWKDGKIRCDSSGEYQTDTGVNYRVGKTKPNTLDDRHIKIFERDDFFQWACTVRELSTFDIHHLDALQGSRFDLWSSTVIPAFLLHCLQPRIYPIVDRWVIVTFNDFQPSWAVPAPPKNITIDDYMQYRAWWRRLLLEAGLDPLTCSLKSLKDLDSGIWAWGKRSQQLSSTPTANPISNNAEEDYSITPSAIQPLISAKTADTGSDEFKRYAVALWKGGETQANAMRKAAMEFGIQLKPSYLAYPGSHFDRWKKQGFH